MKETARGIIRIANNNMVNAVKINLCRIKVMTLESLLLLHLEGVEECMQRL